MKVSRSTTLTAVSPVIRPALEALIQNNARSRLSAVTAMTDSSTGVVAPALVSIPTPGRFTHTGGATIASRTAFNTAIGKVDEAINVLAKHLSDNGMTKAELGAFILNASGAITTAGTIPALDKTVTGTDGAANAGLKRTDAAASISALRNNLSTVVRAYNALAVALGVSTVQDATGGKASLNSFALVNEVVASAGVGPSGDPASKADVDVVLTAFATDIATLASKINTILFAAATINGRVPVTLVP